jgi:hypothetical protein
MWDLDVSDMPLRMAAALAGPLWGSGAHEIALTRTRTGDAALHTRYVHSLLPARFATEAVA